MSHQRVDDEIYFSSSSDIVWHCFVLCYIIRRHGDIKFNDIAVVLVVEVLKHGNEKNVLIDNHVFLIEKLDFENTDLQQYLVAKKVLTLNNVERLEVCSLVCYS